MTFVLDPLLFFPGMPQVSFKSHSLYFWPDFVGCWPGQVLACTGFSQPALPLGSYSPLICLSPRQQPGGMFVCGGLFLHLRILPSHDSTLKFKASLQLFEQLSKAPGPPLSLCLLRKGRSERSQFTSFGVEMGSKSLGSACWKIPASLWWRSCALLRISRGAVTLRQVQRGFFFSLLSLSVSSPRLLPALCQGFDFCQLWPGPFSYLLSFQLCSAWAPLVY